MQPYVSGSTSGGTTISETRVTRQTNDVIIGDHVSNSSEEVTGQLDECFVYAGALSPQSMCYISSCGIDGTACTRRGDLFDVSGRYTTNGGSRTLPTSCQDTSVP